MTTGSAILESLNEDLAREHGAIFQYVIHAVQLRDSALADAVKRVSREEMWHLEWLVEAIRDRGGTPTLDRAGIFTSGVLAESLHADADTEVGALAHYARTLEIIGDTDPDLTSLIERIVDDERHHKAIFDRLAEDVDRDGEQAHAATPRIHPGDLGVIGPAMVSEYTGILQYLWNKYGCGDCEAEEDYFELAIDEMKHAGWVATHGAGMGVPQPPDVPADKVASVHTASAAREAALALEGSAEAFYVAKTPQASNPDLRSDMERAAFQHTYHRRRLREMG